ncbi:c-type cytochrome [Nitrospira sp. Kam-Ns4a]
MADDVSRRRKCAVRVLVLLCALNVSVLVLDLIKILHGTPVSYCADEKDVKHCDLEKHFKYGSIGSDNLKAGLPYWLFKVLPTVVPPGEVMPTVKGRGYEAFGLIVERDRNGNLLMDRPLGFSRRRIGIRMNRLGVDWGVDVVGINCALCHASALRRPGQSERHEVIAGMPGQTVDVEKFFVYLFKAAKHKNFESDTLLRAIAENRRKELGDPHLSMGLIQRTVYRFLITLYRWEIGRLERKFCFLHGLDTKQGEEDTCPTKLKSDAGPGRIDTWAPYKVLRLQAWTTLGDLAPDFTFEWMEDSRLVNLQEMPVGEAQGFADAASIWNLQVRMGRGFHWDGNTTQLTEAAITAAVGVGATPAALDRNSLDLMVRWAKTLAPPKYDAFAPKPHDPDRSAVGRRVYLEHCAACHSPDGHRFGMVEPIENVGTDRHRLDAFTNELAAKLKRKVGKGYDWQFRLFRTTEGYNNVPLDGLWLRAPYLHNGSVPTLRDLLKKPDDRPKRFCRGNDEYDWTNVGFVSTPPCGTFFLYDTRIPGNGNQGHLDGTDLRDDEKEALLEYLKTL